MIRMGVNTEVRDGEANSESFLKYVLWAPSTPTLSSVLQERYMSEDPEIPSHFEELEEAPNTDLSFVHVGFLGDIFKGADGMHYGLVGERWFKVHNPIHQKRMEDDGIV